MTARVLSPLERADQDAAAVAAPDGQRVTLTFIEGRIVRTDFIHAGMTTIAILEHVNGYKQVGTSGCADPKNYNRELGEKAARDAAIRELWALEGFLLREKLKFGHDSLAIRHPVRVSYGQPHDMGAATPLEVEEDGFCTAHPKVG